MARLLFCDFLGQTLLRLTGWYVAEKWLSLMLTLILFSEESFSQFEKTSYSAFSQGSSGHSNYPNPLECESDFEQSICQKVKCAVGCNTMLDQVLLKLCAGTLTLLISRIGGKAPCFSLKSGCLV